MDCLPDNTPLVEIPPEAYVKAAAMRAIMALDLEEEQIAERVMAFDMGDMDMQLAVWSLLVWKEQNAWRQYRQIANIARRIADGTNIPAQDPDRLCASR